MSNLTYKRCPACDTATGLDSLECPNCKHAFRTQFTPPGLNQTQVFPPPLNPPTPVHIPTKKRRVRPAFLVVGISIILLTCFTLWFIPLHQTNALVGSWVERDEQHESGITFNANKTGVMYTKIYRIVTTGEITGTFDNSSTAAPFMWDVDGKYLTVRLDREPAPNESSLRMGTGNEVTGEYELSNSGNILKTLPPGVVHIFKRKEPSE